jgi:hypothetical protein
MELLIFEKELMVLLCEMLLEIIVLLVRRPHLLLQEFLLNNFKLVF